MAQVFIGKHLGAGEPQDVGPCVWQMGWISLLSMLLILPLGIMASTIFFKDTIGGSQAQIYFITIITINFLFPLGAALSSFYLAQGLGSIIMCSTFIACGLHFFLDVVLIFGVPGLFPPLGILGASLSVVIGRIFFCGMLLMYFFQQPFREKYQTLHWKIDLYKIRKYTRICTPRAMGRVLTLFTWALTSHFMVIKGENYLLVLSIGGTIILFCYFFTESVIQALTLVFSRYLGASQYQAIGRSLWTSFLFIIAIDGGLSILLLIFPDFILSFFFSELPSEPLLGHLRRSLYWVWGWLVATTFGGPFLAFLLAMKNTRFYMIVMMMAFLTSALPVYYCINRLDWDPDKFWMILVVEQSVILFLYASRAYWLLRTLKRVISIPT